MALGMIECFGFVTSVVVADKGLKTADVELVAIDKNKPANADKCEVPLVMVVKFMGDPSAVQAAHDRGVDEAKKRNLYITSKIIAGLDPSVEWFAHLTATGRDKLRYPKTANTNEAPAAEEKPAAPKKTSSKKSK